MPMTVLAVVLILVGLFVLVSAWRGRPDASGPRIAGFLVADVEGDALGDAQGRFVDPARRLRGRPDAVVHVNGGRYAPVEAKSRRKRAVAYPADRVQLAAYVLMMRATLGEKLVPSFGVFMAGETPVPVELTGADFAQTERLIEEAQRLRAGTLTPSRSHDDPRKCAGCAVRHHCPSRLA